MKPRAPASGRLTQARLARERAAASHSHGTNRARGPRWNQKRHAERLRAVPWLGPPTDRTGPADRTGVNGDAERSRAVPWLRPPTDRTGPADRTGVNGDAERSRAVPWLRPPTDRTGPAYRTGVNGDAERLRAVPWLRPPTDRTGPAAPAPCRCSTRMSSSRLNRNVLLGRLCGVQSALAA